MTRELTSHKINECNEAIKIEVLDEPGHGGACHDYNCSWPDHRGSEFSDGSIYINFQSGPIKEVGTNGITHEALLAILIDRMEHFQAGEYACNENQLALDHLNSALEAMLSRTRRRVEAGTEGTHAGA